jgi:formate dehydrogenase iron-sulfur subunit
MQSPSPSKPEFDAGIVTAIVSRLRDRPGPLLEVLHAVQEALGYVPAGAVPIVAHGLNLSRAEVHGAVTFYHYFRQSPPGKHAIKVCRAEACQARGGAQLEMAIKAKFGIDYHEVTANGAFSLEPVYCLGNCACGPAVMIDDVLHGGVTSARFDELIGASTSGHFGQKSESTSKTRAGESEFVVYVPRDSSALSLGAEAVASAIEREAAARKIAINLVRTGSHGMFWLEPLVEVMTPNGRIAYGPVAAEAVTELFDADFLGGGKHALHLGSLAEIPYFRRQNRVSFGRVGVVDPLDINDYLAHGGYRGLRNALARKPQEIVKAVTDSGLRGRGGAAFPTGVKWQTVLDQPAAQKYIACNADEGDSGTFADRMLMEGDPFTLIEGMTIAGLAVGATQGYVYLRAEYPHAHRVLNEAVSTARRANFLGMDILGSGKRFEVEIRLGAGAYICGEETSMLESLEGRRGEVRVRPPLPAIKGLFGMPTVVNNVLSFAAVPTIIDKGADFYRALGVGKSRGTLTIQLAGNIKCGGLIELPFGITLRELLYDFGGGTASGRPIRAVQIGGPLGAYIPASEFDVIIDYEALTGIGALLGHGGIVVFDDTIDMAHMARYAMEFCAVESCGKCTPCRIGSTRGVELIDRIVKNEDRERHVSMLNDLCETMLHGSLCGLGGMTPIPVQSALKHFPADFLPKPQTPRPKH